MYGVGLAVAMSSAAGAQSLSITSPSFSQGGQILPPSRAMPAAAVNPQLVFSNVPAKTAALVLIMDDPDVPKTR